MKTTIYKLTLFSALIMALSLSSCKKSESPDLPMPQEVEITLKNPIQSLEGTFSDISATFTSIDDATEIKAKTTEINKNVIKLTLKEGKYKAHIVAKLNLVDKQGVKSEIAIEIKKEIEVKRSGNAIQKIELTPEYEGLPLMAKIIVNKPIGLSESSYSNMKASFTNVRTGDVIEVKPEEINDGVIQLNLDEGQYKLHIEAELHLTNEYGINSIASIKIDEDIEVKYADKLVVEYQFTPDYQPSTTGFVIDEIYFSPSLTPEGKSFTYVEQYIKITNNSDEILYADGIALMESAFLTIQKWDYKPDIMSQAFATDAIAVIPGNGTEHPVAPGESIIIANNAQNHTLVNPNAVDLSKADFEWYDESPNPNFQDVDNPDVPNLDRWYASTATVHSFHQRGVKSVAIAKLGVTKEEYLKDYKYDYTYLFVFNDFSKEMSGSAYKMPNSNILDAVNLSIPAGEHGFMWIVTDPSLDSGWTGWRDSFNDKTAYGMAVRRKVQSENESGRKYLMDTNNSTNDFDRRVKPTLKEQN